MSLGFDFVLANSADSDEMPHYVAFYLGLHCSQKYLFSGFQSTKVSVCPRKNRYWRDCVDLQ